MEWFNNLPQHEGDFLWIWMWGCNCCVARNGIVTIKDVTDADEDFKKELEGRFMYLAENSNVLAFFGPDEDIPTIKDGKPEVSGWLELTSLPRAIGL
jgi:hypothetical protein